LHRYFVRLSYDGSKYNGWQSQPNQDTVSIQATVNQALTTLHREEINLIGCGRTDTGVHAKDYYAHFDVEKKIDITTLRHRANIMLPKDITIHDFVLVDQYAHARFDAISRSYAYHLHTAKNPFIHNSFYYTYHKPALKTLNECASILKNYSDFTTFAKLHSDVGTMFCKIESCNWEQTNEHQFVFNISADRFLRGMIRMIVGMCLDVDRKKYTLDHVKYALQNKIRTGHEWSVPAVGLTLFDVKYPYIL
jgi:tRNA pseudouridine38-40 synthase